VSGSVSYSSVVGIRGPLMIIRSDGRLGYEELVEIEVAGGERRLGRVLQAGSELAVIEVFEGTQGIATNNVKVKFIGKPLELPVSNELLGRVFDGLGRPLDGMPEPVGKEEWDINGLVLNPYKREYPDEFIQTGVSVIDGMLSLIRGQKLPIFSGSGLPHDAMAAQIARQSTIARGEEFAVVFAAIGVPADTAMFFRGELERSGALRRSVLFLNLAEDPAVERIVTPRVALTAAEYLAFEEGMHVLAILTDMTNYGEALREISILRDEVPSRRGYPGYLYTDLATIFERSGRITGKKGSLTQLPILSMPADDITHPIPDLTAYITEGQIVLSKDLYHKGVYPPVNVLMSLSRLMKDGVGKGKTRQDHKEVSDQLYNSYAKAMEVRALAEIVGEEGVPESSKKYLAFAERFEREFINQGQYENRDIETTLNIAWDVLSTLPESELVNISEENKRLFMKGIKAEAKP